MIVITSKLRIGDIHEHTIYKVQTTELIPYAHSMSHLNEHQVIEIIIFKEKRILVFFFSTS